MEDIELEKYKEIVTRISDLKNKIDRYLHNNQNEIDGMSYGEAMRMLSYFRNRLRITPKAIRERYAKSKEV